MSKRILILGDSCSMPRSFPKGQEVEFEETYISMLKNHFSEIHFAVITQGGATSSELISQALAYFPNWKPDLIIMHSGMADCRPEPIPNLMRMIIDEVRFFGRLKLFFYSNTIMPKILRFISFNRISREKFKRNISKLVMIFSKSKIMWCEIYTSASGGYEAQRPGVLKNIKAYNEIISGNAKIDFIKVHVKLNDIGGVNPDHLHLTKIGQLEIFNILKDKIDQFYREKR